MAKEKPSIVWFLLGGAGLFVMVFGLKNTSSIVSPILLAAIIAVSVTPVIKWLMGKGLPAWLAQVITIGLLVAVIAGFVLLMSASINELSASLPQYADSLDGQQEATQTKLADQGIGGQLGISLPEIDSSQVMDFLGSFLGGIASVLSGVVLMLVVLIFLIVAAPGFPSKLKTEFPGNPPTLKRFSKVVRDLRQYMSVTTGINFLVGLVDVVFLVILGVDYALLWGLLAFLLGYVPAVGFWVALIPPFLLAWAELGPSSALIVLVGYVLINGGVQNFIQPKVMGQGVNLAPLAVVLSLVFWGWVLGPMGALLAVPMTVLVKDLVLESFDDSRGLARLISGGTSSAKPATPDDSSPAASAAGTSSADAAG
jgi:predicted PurR-regulated permease PerM